MKAGMVVLNENNLNNFIQSKVFKIHLPIKILKVCTSTLHT
jgi:hypothetical protein